MSKCKCGKWLVSYETICGSCKKASKASSTVSEEAVKVVSLSWQGTHNTVLPLKTLHDSNQAAVVDRGVRRVRFASELNTEHDVTPKEVRFGIHPKHFHFDKLGRKLPLQDLEWTEKGVRELRRRQPDLYEAAGKPQIGDQVVVEQLLTIAHKLQHNYAMLTQLMIRNGDLLQMTVEMEALVWTDKGARSIRAHMPAMYELFEQPVAGEEILDEQVRAVANKIGSPPSEVIEKLTRQHEVQEVQVKAELEWTADGVHHAQNKCPDLFQALGRPAEHDRLSAVQVLEVSEFVGKSALNVTKELFSSGDVSHARM